MSFKFSSDQLDYIEETLHNRDLGARRFCFVRGYIGILFHQAIVGDPLVRVVCSGPGEVFELTISHCINLLINPESFDFMDWPFSLRGGYQVITQW